MIKDENLDVNVNLDSVEFKNDKYQIENPKEAKFEDIDISLPQSEPNMQGIGKYSLKEIPANGKKEADKSTKASSSTKPIIPLFSWEFWQQYTDVTQIEVKDRIISSLNPIKPVFKIIVEKKVDLYGPFWLATLFIFVQSVSGNFSSLLWEIFLHIENKEDPEKLYRYDFQDIGLACGMVYGVWFFFSQLYFLMSTLLGDSVGLITCMCVYGYSYTIWIIAGILCIIPINLFRWIFMIIACLHSILFILTQLSHYITKSNNQYKIGAVILTLSVQLFMMIYYKVKFY